jgi:hypothetical protein
VYFAAPYAHGHIIKRPDSGEILGDVLELDDVVVTAHSWFGLVHM